MNPTCSCRTVLLSGHPFLAPKTGSVTRGKSFFRFSRPIKESSGGFETYELADSEFKPYVPVNNQCSLNGPGLGRTWRR